MTCPQCKTQNPEGRLLCSRCGHSLSASSPANASAFSASATAPNSVAINPAATLGSSVVEEGTPYKASGRWNAPGLLRLIAAGIVAALVVGVIYHLISQFINLIVIFPLIGGALLGFAIAMAVRGANIRNPFLVGTVAALAGLLMMGTMHTVRSLAARGDMIEGFTQSEMAAMPTTARGKDGKTVKMTDAQIAAAEQGLRKEISDYLTPWNTVQVYESLAAQAGTSIGRSSSGIPIQGNFYWALRIGEVLLVMLASAAIASQAASAPYCENCQKWQEDKTVMKAHPSQNALLAQSIAARDWNGLMETPPGEATDEKNITTVKVTRCPDCNAGTLDVTSLGGSSPPEFKQINIAPDSTKVLVEKANAANAPGTG